MMASLLAPALAQGQQQQKATSKTKNQTEAAAPAAPTPGRIAKFTGTKTLGDSNITEDDSGKIGVGVILPTSPLTVNGLIETTSAQGGVKFPDGTVQTTAGLPAVFRDDTLKGDGSQAAPLGLAVPLTLTGAMPQSSSVLVVSNTATFGDGITINAGPKGQGLRVQGGSSSTIGGAGLIATGGTKLRRIPCHSRP